MQARYYDPVIGRFYSNDPVGYTGEVDTFNRYSYVANNPYKYTDPTGEHKERGSGAGALAAVILELAGLISPETSQAMINDATGTKGAKRGPKTKMVNPKNLVPTQTKSEMSGSKVKKLTKSMKKDGFVQKEGDLPVSAVKNSKTGKLELEDGHHRTAAAKAAKIDKIPVEVFEEGN
jgi:uncharacterized protein RhaS with RHS repeats